MKHMNRVTLEAHAKINLSLDITGKREDGYHEVRMIMQELSLHDDIMVSKRPDGRVKISGELEGVKGNLSFDDSNLCVKAAKKMKEKYAIEDGFDIFLRKRIPIAAGLAGGSTDAAAVLKAVRELENMEPYKDPNENEHKVISDEELSALGAELGADIPYCLMGGTALAEGIGEKLTPLKPFPHYPIILVKPNFEISTRTVYEKYDALEEIRHPDTDKLINLLDEKNYDCFFISTKNALEDVTAKKHYDIVEIEDLMYDKDALLSMMSGSGPTVFSIFEDDDIAARAYNAVKEKFSDRAEIIFDYI